MGHKQDIPTRGGLYSKDTSHLEECRHRALWWQPSRGVLSLGAFLSQALKHAQPCSSLSVPHLADAPSLAFHQLHPPATRQNLTLTFFCIKVTATIKNAPKT